jgi:hypothetical protein
MRKSPKGTFLGCLILMLAVMPSCALFDSTASPSERYVDLQEAFIVGVVTATDAKREGLISQDDYDEIVLPLIIEGDRLLDDMKAAIEAGQYDQFRVLSRAALRVVTRLQAVRQ